MIYLFIGIPLAAAVLCVLLGKHYKKVPELVALAAVFALAAMSLNALRSTANGQASIFSAALAFVSPVSIKLSFDGFSSLMLLLANAVALVTVLYSVGYMRGYTDRWKYYCLFLIMAAGVNGVLLTRDIFNLYVYMEMATISIYALVAFGTEQESFEASFKYAVMGVLASAFIFMGIALLYGYTSSLNMADIALVIAARGPSKLPLLVSALFLVGFGLKSALVPFHAWLPDAYSKSPATVPVLSSGILIKALGIYALCRIFFNIFGMSGELSFILIFMAVASMSIGAVMAFGQTNIRRLLGYSSISQIGYIALGLGIGTPLALAGSILHVFSHSASKSLLFLSAGSAEEIFKTTDMDKMSGLAEKSRTAGYCGLVGALSVCGVPPFIGFWSKLLIILACVQAGRPGLGFFAALVSILTLAYYFRFITPVIFGRIEGPQDGRRPAFSMKVALAILTVAVILGGLMLLPDVGGKYIDQAVAVLLAPGVGR